MYEIEERIFIDVVCSTPKKKCLKSNTLQNPFIQTHRPIIDFNTRVQCKLKSVSCGKRMKQMML
ncbi:unnamed protein product, partial [Allacma fusca]